MCASVCVCVCVDVCRNIFGSFERASTTGTACVKATICRRENVRDYMGGKWVVHSLCGCCFRKPARRKLNYATTVYGDRAYIPRIPNKPFNLSHSGLFAASSVYVVWCMAWVLHFWHIVSTSLRTQYANQTRLIRCRMAALNDTRNKY